MTRRARHAARGLTALFGVLVAEALWTARRPLPTMVGADASGIEGHLDGHPLIVLALGDSTLTGPGLTRPEDVWVRQAARLAAGTRHITVVSHAVGGARVASVRRDQLALARRVEPDVIVLAVGSNDAIHHTPSRRLAFEYRQLLSELLEISPRVVAAGVGDLGALARVPWPLTHYLTSLGRRTNRTLRRVATETSGVRFVDTSVTDGAFRLGGRSLFTKDLFHPNELGHALWAEMVAPVLREALAAADPVARG
jgi:acyl-CoA thioesterase-1